MSGSGKGQDKSLLSSFLSGVKSGPQAYFSNRKFNLSGQQGPSEPSQSVKTLVKGVGVSNTLQLGSSTYHGVLSPSEQDSVKHVGAKTGGTLLGSVGTGLTVGKGLSMLQRAAPRQLKPFVFGAQLFNMGLTGVSLARTPEYLNQGMKERAPDVHAATSKFLPVLASVPPSQLKPTVASVESLFHHSQLQREKTGKSSFVGVKDLSRVKPFP
ncbi:hypothetical protein [Chitiniphilus eburneus]|uniref:Uncharacterized protein n=1 Tax=Chitiniphilus eburneus TaxID=2571148 RepID=A0A4U0PAG8_9NEIS|nr:hypothetical protein [Chitiniphilus eburneus]TJZ64616.1 hypothetical protein FAZ21_18870 [Chitiniphilus eburneus]